MPQIGYAHRQAPMGRDGMVASCHPLASLAGVEVMRSGGNVVDAAVATNAVLGVTQPNYCGVGGDLFCLYYEAMTRKVHFLNGAGRSGSRATLDELSRRSLERVPTYGPASVSVPGVTRAWRMLLEEFGTRPLRTLLEPAVHYARHGFPHQRYRLPGDPGARAGQRRSRVAARLHPRRQVSDGGPVLPSARPGPRAERSGRRPRAVLSRVGGARHHRSPRRRRIPDRRRSGRAYRRVERADLDHVPRLYGVRDAAAHPGTRGAPEPQPARGLRSREPSVPVGGAPAPAARGDQARLCRPRPLGGRSRSTRALPIAQLLDKEYAERAAAALRPRQGAAPSVGRSGGRHHGLRRGRRARQRAERDPEPLQVVRLGRRGARHRRRAAESRGVLQH